MVTQTSRAAYAAIKKTIGPQQQRVFDAIKIMGRASNEDIHILTGIRTSSVTPRCKELRDYGYVAPSGYKKSLSGMTVHSWAIVDPQDRKVSKMVQEQDCEG